MKKGFTLVELAIVVVIIGLLVSGVLAGQELIKQARISNLVSQIKGYSTAMGTFRAKYNGLPGDLNNAHMFGLDADKQGNLNVVDTGCTNNNGDGDGVLSGAGCTGDGEPSSNLSGEPLNFWVHLSNAELIKESYSQTNDCVGQACSTNPGAGLPAATIGTSIVAISARSGRIIFLSGVDPSLDPGIGLDFGSSSESFGHTLLPEEAYSIDSKLDDGKPDSGIAKHFYSNACEDGYGCLYTASEYNALYSIPTLDATTCYSGADADYNHTLKSKVCTLSIRMN